MAELDNREVSQLHLMEPVSRFHTCRTLRILMKPAEFVTAAGKVLHFMTSKMVWFIPSRNEETMLTVFLWIFGLKHLEKM